MKLQKYISKLLDVLIAVVLLLFFASFGFRDGRTSGWYQQFLPNLNGQPISDVFFLDSLTGWAVTGTNNGPGHINYIIKTTNGGDNWNIIFTDTCFFSRINFINLNSGFACGSDGGGFAYFYKSTNGGINWIRLFNTEALAFEDMSILNQDTIWVVDHNSFSGGVYQTTNGGLSWSRQLSAGTENPNKIYMFNERIGFICNNTNGSGIKKTTTGGNNWFPVVPNEGFKDIYFVDSLIGWRANDNIKKSTDGGLTWVQQQLPQGINGQTIFYGIRSLSCINKDTLWGSYAQVGFPNNQSRGILFRTTNSGNAWYYQIPDTSFHIYSYNFTRFITQKIGWSYFLIFNGIHTLNGGDTTFLSAITPISNKIPRDFILHQNYPNPFNNKSNIKYRISKSSNIKIIIFDINGKELETLLNKKQSSGEYQVLFDGSNLTSGIYFYSLYADGIRIDTKKAVLIK
jgi:hypothetical protein